MSPSVCPQNQVSCVAGLDEAAGSPVWPVPAAGQPGCGCAPAQVTTCSMCGYRSDPGCFELGALLWELKNVLFSNPSGCIERWPCVILGLNYDKIQLTLNEHPDNEAKIWQMSRSAHLEACEWHSTTVEAQSTFLLVVSFNIFLLAMWRSLPWDFGDAHQGYPGGSEKELP